MGEGILDALLWGQVQVSQDPLADSLLEQHQARYWGPATAPINWCEEDYVVSPYIAEFFNTISNLVYLLCGLAALRTALRGYHTKTLPSSFIWLAASIVFTGIASALFHCTLWFSAQRLDEIFENSAVLTMFHLSRSARPALALILLQTVLSACGIVLVTGFLFCEVHLIGMALLTGYSLSTGHRTYITPALKRRVSRLAASILAGGVCWLLDRVACDMLRSLPVNPQLHAAWHLFTGYGLYEAFHVLVQLRLLRTDNHATKQN
jgi:dihydroceramidase